MKKILTIIFIVVAALIILNQSSDAQIRPGQPNQFPWDNDYYDYPFNMPGYPGNNCQIRAFSYNEIDLTATVALTSLGSVSQQTTCNPNNYTIDINVDYPYAMANPSSYLSVSQKNYIWVRIEQECGGTVLGRVAGLVAATANPMYAVFAVTLDDSSIEQEFGLSVQPVGMQQQNGISITMDTVRNVLLNSGWFMPLKKGKWVGQCMAFAPQDE